MTQDPKLVACISNGMRGAWRANSETGLHSEAVQFVFLNTLYSPSSSL